MSSSDERVMARAGVEKWPSSIATKLETHGPDGAGCRVGWLQRQRAERPKKQIFSSNNWESWLAVAEPEILQLWWARLLGGALARRAPRAVFANTAALAEIK